MALSLRSKLVLWHTALMALVLAAFAYAIYSYLSYGLLKIVDASLLRVAAIVERNASNAVEAPGQATPPIIVPQFVQMVEPDGTISDQIPDAAGHSLPVEVAQLTKAAASRQPQFDTLTVASGELVRVITYPVWDNRQEADYFIRIGQSLSDLQMAQRRVLWLLAWTMPLALGLTVVGGYWLAQRALTPVDRLTSAARHISEKNLSERVEAPQTQDELGRLAATFNDMIARLEQAFERQRQFTADASHELRTPLAIMRNDLEITLRREREPEEYRRVLTSTLEENIRLSKLVSDLLTLARSDSGEVELEQQPVQLDRLAREVGEYTAPLAQAKGLTLTIDTTPATVSGDAKRLKQLMLNLLDNAIKYTNTGGQITLSLAPEAEAAVLRVRDSGQGIAATDLPRVFDRFFRHSHARSDEAGGTGLGLAICKWIVEAHGGQISVSSAVGAGTEFRVVLPCAESPNS